jgi:predicted Zn-dependent peptidase
MANVKRFTTGEVRRHFARFYGARNMVLCVTGPVNPDEVAAQAQKAFSRLPVGERVAPRAAPGPRGEPLLVVVPNEAAQTQVQVVFHGLPDVDPDYMALSAMMRLLDDGMSTRLHYQICDQKGLAYQVSGALEPLHDTALIDVDAACAHGKLFELVEQSLALLRQFRDEAVSDKDLAKAKRRYRGDIESSFDDLDSLGGWYGGTELFYKPRTHAMRVAQFEALTAADVQRVARRVLVPERLTVAAVGEVKAATAKRLRTLMAGFAA